MRLFVVSAALLACLASPALADDGAAQQIRRQYDDCVYGSAASIIKSSPITDMNTVAETAFQSCVTEENAMVLFLQLSGGRSQQIAAGITAIKLQIKRSLRDIAANPAKFAR